MGVFGRKETPQKPSPPSVDQILEDLQAADPDDPIYTLNPTLNREVIEADPDSDVNRNYCDVLEFVSKEKRLKQLKENINFGFDQLVSSQKVLTESTTEVENQLKNIKVKRGEIGNDLDESISKEDKVTLEEKIQEFEDDLC